MKGQKISDRYQIIKNIGEGGMANVYLAYDTILDREVAVKVLRGDLANDEKFVRRFQREALAASSLSNQNVVEVYDVGEDGGEYYIVMEYVEGKHLKTLIKKRGKLTLSEVVDIGLQITNGLSVAHDSYLIHRDIKPQNILILDNGLIKITDFGIAVALNATQLTQTNSVMGSVHYLPPEQAMGKTSTLQSDIYSIGVVLYELLVGKLPFTGDNAVEIALKHLKESVPCVRDEIPNIPQSLENIIIRATAKNPKNRYADAREMHEDLKTCLSEARKNEKKITLKYSDTDYDETKVMKIVKPTKDSKETKKNIKEKEVKEEEVIAKKINRRESKKQNKTLLILASIFTGLVLIVTTLVVLLPTFLNTEYIVVPDVENLTQEDAIDKLQDAGFIVADDYVEQASKTVEEGLVIKSNPLEGSKRKPGSEITLYISLGNVTILIEDYTDVNSNEIKGKLEALGLQVLIEKQEVEITEDNEDEYEENIIIGQSVEAGSELSEGDIITLYIPKLDAKYPDFLEEKFTLDEVKEFAEKYDLDLEIEEVETTEYDDGIVFYQSRNADVYVTSGADLKIKVAVNDGNVVDQEGEVCTPDMEDLGICETVE